MPEQVPVTKRFVERLAAGVQRCRLVDPVLSCRPPLVVVSAPSGYGKTAFAAQLATSGAFARVHWIDGLAESGSMRRLLFDLLRELSPAGLDPSSLAQGDLAAACSAELAALDSESHVLVVLDDVGSLLNGDSLGVLEELASEAPARSVFVITSRTMGLQRRMLRSGWMVDTASLRFTDAEIAGVWRLLAGHDADPARLIWLSAATGRHAALVALVARSSALGALGEGALPEDSGVTALVSELILGQLDVRQRRLLDYAALVREGSVALLGRCAMEPEVGTLLEGVAAVLPLVSYTGVGHSGEFAVHSLVLPACSSARAMAADDIDGLSRTVETLAADGRCVRGLEVAMDSGDSRIVAECLRSFGSELLSGPNEVLARAALESIPVALVASDPELMRLTAEAIWLSGDLGGGLRAARLAARLAEHMGQERVRLKASLMSTQYRAATGDYTGITAEIEPLLAAWEQIDDAEDRAVLLLSAELAYAFLGDTSGLSRCQRLGRELVAGDGLPDIVRARLSTVDALVSGMVHGDYVTTYERCRASADYPMLTLSQRLSAIANSAAGALHSGMVDEALRTASYGLSIAFGRDAEVALVRSLEFVQAAATRLLGGTADVETALEAIAAGDVHGSDALGLTSTLTHGATDYMVFGQHGRALAFAERGLRTAMSTGSPVLVWLAELLVAQASLAIGDVQRARLTAERILPQVEAIGAMGHVLHARMILAQAALNDGDLASAVEHLSAVSDHIVEKSPALAVASYLRAFPGMFGPLALAMGVDRIPVRVLNLMKGQYGAEALEQAAAVLTPTELARLSARMRMEAERAAELEKAVETDAVCTVRLFGGLEVITPRGPVGERDWTKRKARLLFAMLLSRFGTDVPRGEIIEYLWPEMDEERALNNFYVVWSAMKRALSPESVRETPCPFVEHMHGVCRVVPGRVVSDLDRFAELLGVARQARSDGDASSELAALRSVADLYRGEVLPGDVYDDWFAPLRERFRHDFEDAMLRASQLLEERGDPRGGLSMLRHAMSHDPWREDLYQASLRLQIAAGQRSAAIETYMSCRNRLVEDLGIDPSRETTALYEQVLGMEEGP